MSDAVDRLNTALQGRYRIERELGEGGMATVYLARDAKHERLVALKVLKPELAAVVGAERFLAEIKTTANLQHPHILPLYDSGEADGQLFYVMPYVEGESLRDRLAREHQLPVDDAVRIATNLAEALDYAHRHGVIHRDIKPANVLLQDGKPVISDFGIALAVGAAGGGRLTETGLSLGTPFYMSPEQATGDQNVGPASDLYAVGCVLYEMLVGEPPFTGSTPQAVLGKILSSDAPSARAGRASVPEHVDAVIAASLEKVPADRFVSADELARALRDPSFGAGAGHAPVRPGAGGARGVPLWSYVVMGVLAIVAAIGWFSGAEPPPADALRVVVQMDSAQARSGNGRFDLARDGSFLVYAGQSPETDQQLWLRRWDALDATPVPGSDGAQGITISPDMSQVAFSLGDTMIVIQPLDGGSQRTLKPEPLSCCTLQWGPEGEWVYYQRADGFGIGRMRATGGEAEMVTTTDSVYGFHEDVEILPGGQKAVMARTGLFGRQAQLVVVDLETGGMTPLFDGRYPKFRDGYLFFGNPAERNVYAVSFDPESGEASGSPVLVAQGVRGSITGSTYAIADDGTLVYSIRGGAAGGLEWVGRDGSVEVADERFRDGVQPTFSPDGERIAVNLASSIAVWDLGSGILSTIAPMGPTTYRPSWHPDGSRVIFASNAESETATIPFMYSVPADGSATPRPLGLNSSDAQYSPAGDWIAYRTANTDATLGDIYAIRSDLSGDPIEISAGPQRDFSFDVSHDGRWIAYVTSRAGVDEQLYVTSFPNPGARVQVSLDGGHDPRWSPNGRELFYVSSDLMMMAARYVDEPTFRVEGRDTLFEYGPSRVSRAIGTVPYDVSPDGRFLVRVQENNDFDRWRTVLVRGVFEELARQ